MPAQFQKQVIEFLARGLEAPFEGAPGNSSLSLQPWISKLSTKARTNEYPDQDSLAQHRQDFAGVNAAHTYAIILAPDSARAKNSPPTNNFQYRTKVPQFGNAVADALGIPRANVVKVNQEDTLAAGGVKMRTYTAYDGGTAEGHKALDKAFGKLIFDYDPDAGNGQRQYRVLFERSQILADRW